MPEDGTAVIDFAPGDNWGLVIPTIGGGIKRGTGGTFLSEANDGIGTSWWDFGRFEVP
jgi:hypothetical protein